MRAIVLKTVVVAALVFAATSAGWEKWPCGADGANVMCMIWDDGAFSVDGTGAMADYAGSLLGGSSAPWSGGSGLAGVNTSINRIYIGPGVTSVGNFAFTDCRNVKSVNIPLSVTSVGEGAFSGCAGLTSITSLANVPPAVGDNAFYGVDAGDVSLYVPKTKIYAYRSAVGWDAFDSIHVAPGTEVREGVWDIGVIPETVRAELNSGKLIISGYGDMRDFAVELGDLPPWYGARDSIGGVYIEGRVTSIGRFAFAGCGNVRMLMISPLVTSIGEQAFSGCGNIRSVTISERVTYIGDYAFQDCRSLEAVSVSAKVPPGTGSAPFNRVDVSNVQLSIPAESADAYRSADAWKDFNIQLRYTVNPVAREWDCGAERGTVTCAQTERGIFTVSGSGPMADYAPGDIGGSSAPWSGSGIPGSGDNYTIFKIVIEEGVTSVGNFAFTDCVKLMSVDIPNSVASIGEGAFSGCNGLRQIISLSEDNPDVADDAFSGVEVDSVYVYVPEDVIEIYRNDGGGWMAFGNIESLDAAPASVSSAGRVIPAGNAETAVAAPLNRLTGEFTAGPNPAAKSSNAVSFFRTGSQIKNGQLTVYDASGSVVRKIAINENAGIGSSDKRKVGYWNLTDSKGRPVADGTYLVKGKITTAGGKSERVALIVGIR